MDDEQAKTSHHGIVVSGEASESEDEESCPRSSAPSTLPEARLKYNSLLHRKLRDRNGHLRKELAEIACEPYNCASREISSITHNLIRSQQLVHEVSSTLRRLTNELFQLEDKVDTIRASVLLPDIGLPSHS